MKFFLKTLVVLGLFTFQSAMALTCLEGMTACDGLTCCYSAEACCNGKCCPSNGVCHHGECECPFGTKEVDGQCLCPSGVAPCGVGENTSCCSVKEFCNRHGVCKVCIADKMGCGTNCCIGPTVCQDQQCKTCPADQPFCGHKCCEKGEYCDYLNLNAPAGSP